MLSSSAAAASRPVSVGAVDLAPGPGLGFGQRAAEQLLEHRRHEAEHLAAVGDRVLLNVAALERGLGTGGYALVIAVLDAEGRVAAQPPQPQQ